MMRGEGLGASVDCQVAKQLVLVNLLMQLVLVLVNLSMQRLRLQQRHKKSRVLNQVWVQHHLLSLLRHQQVLLLTAPLFI